MRTSPAPIAEEGVSLIRQLYAIETEIKGTDAVSRLVARQERPAQILTRLDDWLRHHRARASAKSPLGGALACIAKYREGLGRFLTDDRVEIDNNTPSHRYFVSIAGQRYERTIRPIALNHKTRSSRDTTPVPITGASSPH